MNKIIIVEFVVVFIRKIIGFIEFAPQREPRQARIDHIRD